MKPIEKLEAEIKYLKEMVLLIVDFNAKQAEINRQLSDDIRELEMKINHK